MITIGTTEFGDGVPRAAVVIDRKLPRDVVEGFRGRGAALLELRADLFECDFGEVLAYAAQTREWSGLPLLVTLRQTAANRERRLEMFMRLLPLADAVDIEIDTPVRDEVIAMARGKTVIVSEHDFAQTPSDQRLRDLADQAFAAGAHVFKIAAMALCGQDAARLMMFCGSCSRPTIAISMGERGALTRVIAPLFGSLFSYTFVSGSVAPGQLALDDLVREFGRYYPAPAVS